MEIAVNPSITQQQNNIGTQIIKKIKIDNITPEELLESLGNLIEKLVQMSNNKEDKLEISLFSASQKPNIRIQDYLIRLGKYFNCSDSCHCLALIYIDRIIRQNPLFKLTIYNIHRLMLASLLIATKFLDDQYFENSFYATIGGITLKEINMIEKEFLFLINYSLYVSEEDFCNYYEKIRDFSLQFKYKK